MTEVPSVKIGLLKKIAVWIWDFFQMPGRVAELSRATKRDLARIKDCPNCDTRMKVTRTHNSTSSSIWTYECANCRQAFGYTFGL